MPFQAASVDVVVCVDVSHHLTDHELDAALSEVQRVLRPTGRFVFLDAVLNDRWVGRTLWSLDRGSRPRRATDLRAAVSRGFHIRDEEQFRLFHEDLLLVSQPLPSRSLTAPSII